LHRLTTAIQCIIFTAIIVAATVFVSKQNLSFVKNFVN